MKQLVIISILIFTVTAANAQKNKKKSRKERKAEHEAMLVEQTQRLIDEKTWEFDATQMLPQQGRSKTLTSEYSVILKNNHADSHLPYFGRAYSADYGSSDSPLSFKAPANEYSMTRDKKGGYTIKFSAKNKSDKINFTFKVSGNGSTSLSITSTNRQGITYYGDLVPYDCEDK